jgi:phenylpropionate dioxygenase-like ring-hydroxylating dioxygenase large terminal subunit
MSASMLLYQIAPKPAPDYTAAKTQRQKQRAAGLHPDYWYPALWSHELGRGQVKEVVFWKRSFAVFRGQDGVVRALENRCAHRQLKLSLGNVEGCELTCSYHGWTFDGGGQCTHIEHSLFGHKMPNVKIQSFPVQERYGIIFIFPGNPDLTEEHALPEIPEWEKNSGWGKIPADFLWNAHHSIIIDNTCDFTHAYLHRDKRPFTYAELKNLSTEGDAVDLEYDTRVGDTRLQRLFVNQKTTNTNAMKLGYQYPYQWSSTDDKIKHWCFVLPLDERTTRAFFLFYFSPETVRIPGVPFRLPKAIVNAVMPVAKRLFVTPLLDQDRMAVEAEQEGYDKHWDKPVPDLNPVPQAFMQLTIRKWEEYLAG